MQNNKLDFIKMHGAGNDYIYFDCFKQTFAEPEKLAVKLSDRHFGIGGDGIVLIMPSEKAAAKMRMFNADGSEGRMCGNAIRCVAKYVYENITQKEILEIETISGIKTINVLIDNKKAVKARVDMGKPELTCSKIPALIEKDTAISYPILVGGKNYAVTLVSMGNPHAVVFCNNIDNIDIEKIGPLFENHTLFPQRINTEFIEVTGKNTLNMRVWERGSGETLACGTGACAAAVAAVLNNKASKNEDIMVKLRGGDLTVCYTGNAVYMTGSCEEVFRGYIVI